MSDTRYLTDGRPYLTTPQAAHYCGFEPTGVQPMSKDRAIRSFWAWAKRHQVMQCPGRAVWRRDDLDAAINRPPVTTTTEELTAIEALARQHVATWEWRGSPRRRR